MSSPPISLHHHHRYAHILATRDEQTLSIDDDLAHAHKLLFHLNSLISVQSKKHCTLERNLRFLDGRISLLIHNRMQLDQKEARQWSHIFSSHQDPVSPSPKLDHPRLLSYGHLFFLLQSEPRYLASLCRHVSLDQIDALLQTIMFTVYGNQYHSRDEFLLLSMFQIVLSHQLELATDFGSLLRANTPVSRMLTTYTRRSPGQTYLKTLLADRLASLIKHADLNLEINPIKVAQQLHSSSLNHTLPNDPLAMDNHVQALIAPRIHMLIEIATSFVAVIIESLHLVPYGIRWICKQIKGLAKRRFPDASDSDVSSLIGGFFMLRFVNPAIVMPQAFMHIPSPPSPHTRRTLTLLAKMLQHLANRHSATSNSTKESYMTPLYEAWSVHTKERFHPFLMELTNVSDFYDALELDQYVALTTQPHVNLSITTHELYTTHALLVQYQSQVCTPGSHLDLILNDLGPPPPVSLSRSDSSVHELPLVSRWEISITDSNTMLRAQTNTSASEALYFETKSVFVQLLRLFPRLVPPTNEALNLEALAQQVLTRTTASGGGSSSSRSSSHGMRDDDNKGAEMARKALDKLSELERLGVVCKSDQYRILADEVAAELVHLGILKEKVLAKIDRLTCIYRSICEHNEYLSSKLDTYRAYLSNVQMQAGPGSSTSTMTSSSPSRKMNHHKRSASHADGLLSISCPPIPPCPNLPPLGLCENGITCSQPPLVTPSPLCMLYRKFKYDQLEREGLLLDCNVPEQRRSHLLIRIACPSPGSVVVSLEYKGRDKPILELEMRMDDLLAKQQQGVEVLDGEYVQLSVSKLIHLVNKYFMRN